MENSASPKQAGLHRVGWVNTFVAAAASSLYVAVKCNFAWPKPADSAIAIAGAVSLWVLTALIALALLGVTIVRGRRWSWSIVAIPVLVACAIMVAAVGRPHFDKYRTQFEDVAQQLLQEPRDPDSDGYRRDLRIGRFDISYANVSSQGHVYFHDARDGLDFMDNPGWVYAPNGVSEKIARQLRLESIDGGRYRFPNIVVGDY